VNLNRHAAILFERLVADAHELRIAAIDRADGGRTLDLGINAPGGLEAGRRLAELCLAGLGRVVFVPATWPAGPGLAVQVHTDHPLLACLAAQYAGWRIGGNGYFAMGSGPMRAAAAKEPLFQALGHSEHPEHAVGVLESRHLPPAEVCRDIAFACGVAPSGLSLAVAPTASQAGTVQVVARSVETALHKLHELGFPVRRVESGYGTAPLPPVAANDLEAIGRTNDAILYGGKVTLFVRGDDDVLEALGPRVPSNASSDYGLPFAAVFERVGGDFYRIDPMLFSPAIVTFVNLDSGRTWRFGEVAADVLARSFGMG
jgi:methenyltetrahydromethanopterin cyclohydrolase